jgi:hypothetical protein
MRAGRVPTHAGTFAACSISRGLTRAPRTTCARCADAAAGLAALQLTPQQVAAAEAQASTLDDWVARMLAA